MKTTDLLDQDLIHLISLRNQLTALSYADPTYDDLEDALSEAEDTFIMDYGTYLEERLQKLHEAHFPNQEVLLPTAYLASCYQESVIEEGVFELPMDEGILVDWEVAGQPTRRAKLVLVPEPVRFMLFDGEALQLLWSAEHDQVYHQPVMRSDQDDAL